ncbi:NADH-quinone oxidoreductase subunit NuoE [Rickettsiales endosymbiont of Stachyamoeba lipophora]|uniref:NADH-quinone oxidoreductase subunit NuoE n=1 Tax=Rickettsiales endosymbiont of Stachyamoeba lipophora TaxID=2486578 RepID=UPI000F647C43|nr:NADH-quinone oxidoreductase subunit NuoE [Rickettsiales endosymbiont of Stachyamoeba lipophora]AZL16006.1 NADH-quinone oxidoreductase subunit NuoE [Rickettsiales endosymbiont of Stachyamoeba lipophora]
MSHQTNKIESASFEFTKDNLEKIKQIIAKYPQGRQASAVLPVLDIAQRQNHGWLSKSAMDAVAYTLDMPAIKVYEVATFYTMFNLKPIGKYHLQICGTTPCWLRGSNELFKICKDKLGLKQGETSNDNLFTLSEVECLGACVNAPLVQINDDYFEDLDSTVFSELLDKLSEGKEIKHGSQTGRTGSAPIANDANK